MTDKYDYEAFGEIINQTGSTENSYQYTGEQFDQGLEEYYLRTRYYDQSVGRFTQQDTYLGNNVEPVTLHKYLYGNSDPVTNTDPTGHFSVSDVMSTVNIISTLASVAQTSYDTFLATPDEGNMDERSSVWDALFITASISAASQVAADLQDLLNNGKSYEHLTGYQRHHTIPQYLCGAKSQGLVRLATADHTLLHFQLDKLGDILEVAGAKVSKIIKRRSAKDKVSIQKIGKRKLGRIAIVTALRGFYTYFDWMGVGSTPVKVKDYGTIGEGVASESNKFILGNTSCH